LKKKMWIPTWQKKFARPKWFSHKPTKKGNTTLVIRKSHEKIFPSKIRLFFISLNWICANYFTGEPFWSCKFFFYQFTPQAIQF
jgi:hypothetical protein